MKKIAIIVLALAFVMAGVAYAAPNGPSNPNAQWVGGSGESAPGAGPCQYIRVRYAQNQANSTTLLSGTVVSWDVTSGDGYTISACTSSTAAEAPALAGVLISDILTDDAAGYQKGERSVGYMAIKGYCLACVDTSIAATGERLAPSNDVTTKGYFGTTGSGGMAVAVSGDAGVLLSDTGSDGLMPVWLY